jgi:hypothetical protein
MLIRRDVICGGACTGSLVSPVRLLVVVAPMYPARIVAAMDAA